MGDIDLAREAERISYDVINRPVLEPLRGLVRLAADLLGVRMAEINAVSHDHVIHLATSEDELGTVPVVRVMGGEVGVEETAGGGASFWFELPLPKT